MFCKTIDLKYKIILVNMNFYDGLKIFRNKKIMINKKVIKKLYFYVNFTRSLIF